MSELSELEASFEAQSTGALIALALPVPIDDVYDDEGIVTYVTQRWPIIMALQGRATREVCEAARTLCENPDDGNGQSNMNGCAIQVWSRLSARVGVILNSCVCLSQLFRTNPFFCLFALKRIVVCAIMKTLVCPLFVSQTSGLIILDAILGEQLCFLQAYLSAVYSARSFPAAFGVGYFISS